MLVAAETKTCTRCGTDKPVDEFHWRASKGAYRSQCKVCHNELQRDYKARNKAKVDKANALYRATNSSEISRRGRQRRIDKSDQVRATDAAYRERNRDSLREYHRAWNEENREHLREWHAEYRSRRQEELTEYRRQWHLDHPGYLAMKSHQRRARLAGVESDDSTRMDVWDKDHGICHLCLKQLQLDSDWHVDHIIPLFPVEGEPGSDTIDNKSVACKSCNLRKKNRLIESGAYAC